MTFVNALFSIHKKLWSKFNELTHSNAFKITSWGYAALFTYQITISEQLTVNHNSGRAVISKSMELATEIMAEFIFCELSTTSDARTNAGKLSRVSVFKYH